MGLMRFLNFITGDINQSTSVENMARFAHSSSSQKSFLEYDSGANRLKVQTNAVFWIPTQSERMWIVLNDLYVGQGDIDDGGNFEINRLYRMFIVDDGLQGKIALTTGLLPVDVAPENALFLAQFKTNTGNNSINPGTIYDIWMERGYQHIPIGEDYTRLPGMPHPSVMYPGTDWEQYQVLYPLYSGCVIRLPGGFALPFSEDGSNAPQAQTTGAHTHTVNVGAHTHSVALYNAASNGTSRHVATNDVTGSTTIAQVNSGSTAPFSNSQAGENRSTNFTAELYIRVGEELPITTTVAMLGLDNELIGVVNLKTYKDKGLVGFVPERMTDNLPEVRINAMGRTAAVVDGEEMIVPVQMVYSRENSEWREVYDWRGITVWNTETKTPRIINVLGDEPGENETTVQPPPEYEQGIVAESPEGGYPFDDDPEAKE